MKCWIGWLLWTRDRMEEFVEEDEDRGVEVEE
jgi:hypothetical protein